MLLLQCPYHGLRDHLLQQYFYQSLDAVNKDNANQLICGGIMRQTCAAISTFFDEIM